MNLQKYAAAQRLMNENISVNKTKEDKKKRS